MRKLADTFNQKLRKLYSSEKGRKLFEAEATAAAVILGEPLKLLGQRAVFGNEPVREINFEGLQRPTRFKLRMRSGELAKVAWRENGETFQAWIKIDDEDGRWVVGQNQIIGTNKEFGNERKTGSASGPA
jgi:hypothetical protein